MTPTQIAVHDALLGTDELQSAYGTVNQFTDLGGQSKEQFLTEYVSATDATEESTQKINRQFWALVASRVGGVYIDRGEEIIIE